MAPSKFSYESMGTHWEISIWDHISPIELDKIKTGIVLLSQKFDETYSRFKPTSLVSKISEKTGVYDVPDDFLEMLRVYFDLYEVSDKKLNPLIGFTISDLGYDAVYSLKEKEVVRLVPDLLETVKIINKNEIETKEPVLFDFGALGKGYFVDKIADFLKSKNINQFLVDGSGDIYYFGKESAYFGLEDPDDPTKVVGKLEIKKNDPLRAFCASGTNRRKWPRLRKATDGQAGYWNHEIDATTLEPADFIVATWVQAETCVLADALTTCLFFCPPENFLVPRSLGEVGSNYVFEYLIMNKNREIKTSRESWLVV